MRNPRLERILSKIPQETKDKVDAWIKQRLEMSLQQLKEDILKKYLPIAELYFEENPPMDANRPVDARHELKEIIRIYCLFRDLEEDVKDFRFPLYMMFCIANIDNFMVDWFFFLHTVNDDPNYPITVTKDNIDEDGRYILNMPIKDVAKYILSSSQVTEYLELEKSYATIKDGEHTWCFKYCRLYEY